jgi:phosphatidylserine/phosphatidylglycerophosphate/cardiolipin synthase-like enzyme
MRHLLLSLSFLFVPAAAHAQSVKTLFHPYDATMKESAYYITHAESTVDLALYNVDANMKNPVIAALNSKEVQERIQSGKLSVRIIFEGFASKEANQKKMAKLEAMGLDARYLGVGRKMHHKFATIDSFSNKPVLITGSANWSMMSKRNFHENILYFENKPGVTNAFQKQFDLLWSQSKEFGFSKEEKGPQKISIQTAQGVEEGFKIYFNTENFKITPKGFRKDSSKKGFVLTRQIVDLIDNAEHKIEIATTRIKLRPIYEAIKRAAARGVKIKLVVTMGEYTPSYIRKRSKMKVCDDIYVSKCSTSQNFSIFLGKEKFEGRENVELRAKYFDVRKDSYLLKQMHSKYIIADDKALITGSFNWSVSAEYNHFENIIAVSGEHHPQVLNDFNTDFDRLWSLNRKAYKGLVKSFEKSVERGEKIKCHFEPMSLSFKEIDYLLGTGRRVGKKSLYKMCK